MADVVYKSERELGSNRTLVIVLSIVMVLVLVAGSTVAYLSTKTETESNVFTAGNIAAKLIEPAWKPVNASDPILETHGVKIAEKMLPGVYAPKDPQIVNTSYSEKGFIEPEWVAIRLTFQKSNGSGGWLDMTAADINALKIGLMMKADGGTPAAGIQTAANWGAVVNVTGVIDDGEIKANEFVYVYNTAVTSNSLADGKTDPIFDSVGINAAASADPWTVGVPTMAQYMSWLNATAGANGAFQIKVEGAAIQATGFATRADAINPLLTTFGYTTV